LVFALLELEGRVLGAIGLEEGIEDAALGVSRDRLEQGVGATRSAGARRALQQGGSGSARGGRLEAGVGAARPGGGGRLEAGVGAAGAGGCGRLEAGVGPAGACGGRGTKAGVGAPGSGRGGMSGPGPPRRGALRRGSSWGSARLTGRVAVLVWHGEGQSPTAGRTAAWSARPPGQPVAGSGIRSPASSRTRRALVVSTTPSRIR